MHMRRHRHTAPASPCLPLTSRCPKQQALMRAKTHTHACTHTQGPTRTRIRARTHEQTHLSTSTVMATS